MAKAETIFALSSGLPPSAIAIVRLSGPRAFSGLRHLTRTLPLPRVATRRRLRGSDGAEIDDALVLCFPGPASATGEDVVELHVHGGRAVVRAILKSLGAIEGLRPAEPGEFTRRAFESGKIDLTEAEAIDDLVHADTDAQRRCALRQLDGLLGDRARNWRQAIIDASALIEANIDFAEEEDVSPDALASALEIISNLSSAIGAVLDQPGGERLREGLVVAITGPPNVGKSTLINRLAGRDVAIVSAHAGTTRDVIEVSCEFGGYPLTLIDTAGIRDADDFVEQEGIRRARDRAARADLQLWLTDVSDPQQDPAWPAPNANIWLVNNKIDLAGGYGGSSSTSFGISALTGRGLDELVGALASFAAAQLPPEGALIFRERHRQLLVEARSCLEAATRQESCELIAEELREASQAVGRLLGRVDVEDVLGSIFKNFCIGK